MIWDKLNERDWVKAAPYVDTLLIPVIEVHLDQKATFAKQRRDSVRAAVEMERQLTGRTVLMPPVSYITNDDWLAPYVANIRQQTKRAGFSYSFFLIDEKLAEKTRDIDWGNVITVPELPSSAAEKRHKIRKLCEQLIQKWQEEV